MTHHLTTPSPPGPSCKICTRPFPTIPKFRPEATAIRSSKKGEKARALCVKPGVFTRKTAGGGIVDERVIDVDVCLGSRIVWQTSQSARHDLCCRL